jgi:hypothetical protein
MSRESKTYTDDDELTTAAAAAVTTGLNRELMMM